MDFKDLPEALLWLISEYVGLVRCRTKHELLWVREHFHWLEPCATFGNVIDFQCAHVHLNRSRRAKKRSTRKRFFESVRRFFRSREAPNNHLVARPGQLLSLTIKRAALLNYSLFFQRNLKELHLVGIDMDVSQASLFLEALRKFDQLESLDLNGNSIFNHEQPAAQLGCLLRNHNTLCNVGLANIAYTSGYLWTVVSDLPHTVRELNVSNNMLSNYNSSVVPSFRERFRELRIFHAWNTKGSGVYGLITDALGSTCLERLSTPCTKSIWHAFGLSFRFCNHALTFLTLADFEMSHEGAQTNFLCLLRDTTTLRTLHVGFLINAPDRFIRDVFFYLHMYNKTIRKLAFDGLGLTQVHLVLLCNVIQSNRRVSCLLLNEYAILDDSMLKKLGRSLRHSVVRELMLCESFQANTKPLQACRSLLSQSPTLSKVSYRDPVSDTIRRVYSTT